MGRPEAYVEDYLVTRVKSRGGMCLKFLSATKGIPDRIVILAGQTVFVETKAGGEVPRRLQEVQIGRMRAAGADVRVIDTRGQVDALVEELTALRLVPASTETEDIHEKKAA